MGKKKIIKQANEIKKAMEQRICGEISTFSNVDPNTALKIRRLALALYHGGTCLPIHRTEVKTTAKACFSGIDKDLFQMTLELLFGETEADDLIQILTLRVQGNLSEAIFRTPFHSYNSEDYLESIILPTIFRWICGCGCDLTVKDWLTDPDIVVPTEYDIANRLALEITRDSDVRNMVIQILNNDPHASRNISLEILQAVIRSGFEPGIEQMKQIFSLKHTDTKLKEDILHVIDEGSTQTFLSFLKWIFEERLYRIPIAAKEIDTWLWMGFGTLEPEMGESVLREALILLEDTERAFREIHQGDMLKVHIGLWALAVHNIRQTWPILWDMLQSSVPTQELEQKISAIYFITHVKHEYLDLDITLELLDYVVHQANPEEPYGNCMELLAWLMPNLIPTKLEQVLSNRPLVRQRYFSLLEYALHLIGQEERIFCGKPFPWTVMRLTPELAVEAMLRVATISKDRSMIRSLARNIEYFTPKQRGYFYEYLLDPLHWREDDFFLREHQKDRSSLNRQVIAAKLEEVKKELERTNYQPNRL